MKFDYRPSPTDATGTHELGGLLYSRLYGSAPTACDNSALILSVLDQGGEGSCVANAGAQIVRGELVRAGYKDPPLPSRNFIYYVARAEDLDMLGDHGTTPASALAALCAVGFPAEDVWPYTQETLYTQPSWAAFRQAADQRWLGGYARIESSGSRRIDDMKAALSAGSLIWTGSEVDDVFMNLRADAVWQGPTGAKRGGHSFGITGYDDVARTFDIVNSWGYGWGRGSFGRMSYDAADALLELWAVQAAPPYTGTR